MKRVSIIIGLVLLLSASLSAQVPQKPFNLYFGGGVTVPTGDYADVFKTGFHGSGKIGFKAFPKGEILLGVEYHQNPIDKDVAVPAFAFFFNLNGITDIDGGSAQVLNIGADLKFNFGVPGAPANPYVLGGVGLANYSESDVTIISTDPSENGATIQSDSESKFYFQFGGGLEFSKVFIQGRYVSFSLDGFTISYIPITVGVKF